MDNKKVEYFVKKIGWVSGIPDGYSRADETGVLIGEAKQFPNEAMAACKRVGGGTASSIESAVKHLADPAIYAADSTPKPKRSNYTPTQNEVTGDYDEKRVNDFIKSLDNMPQSGMDHEKQRAFQQFVTEAKRHPADALEAATRLQDSPKRFGYHGLFINEITKLYKKAEPKSEEQTPVEPAQNFIPQPTIPPMKMPEIPPVDMSMFKSVNPMALNEDVQPAPKADTDAMAHVKNLSKPSRSTKFKESFAALKAMGDDAIDTIIVAADNNENAPIASELMQVLGEINTPKAIETLQTLRSTGSTAMQTAAARVLQSIGK